MAKTFTLGNTSFENGKKTLIIAEIGTGHGGNLEKAKELIDTAAAAGADCAKFQIVYADEILHPDTGFVNLPGGKIPLYERFRELELPHAFYRELASYCEKRNLLFLCTPFGARSAQELQTLLSNKEDTACVKIASPELNHLPLLSQTASWGFPLILSSGVSTLRDIERALATTETVRERVLLHCVTSYPAPEADYNLKVLSSLSTLFGIPVGVSDHSLDPLLVPVLSLAAGGCVIEKHICLSRSDSGLDDPVALPPDLFTAMVKEVRVCETLGHGEIINRMEALYGRDTVQEVMGSGVKKLAPSERANYGRTNRSIHFMRSMTKGERIGRDDIALLRTEKVLTVGLDPEFESDVLGAILSRDVESGSGVSWNDLLSR